MQQYPSYDQPDYYDQALSQGQRRQPLSNTPEYYD